MYFLADVVQSQLLNFVAGIVDFFGNFSFQLQSLVAHLIELLEVSYKDEENKYKEKSKK
jgi:hypothetical protein